MLLKNKKTGEILHIGNIIVENPKRIDCWELTKCSSLAELNDEWEDYKGPKGIQCIYYVNHFDAAKIDGVIVGFETKEEAKKAVEKLKAWKRLKDKGFKFKGWKFTPDMKQIEGNYVKIEAEVPQILINEKDLDLLFCTEDK